MALVDSIIGAESRGNPTARNPRSSASGLGQFIDSTWLSMIQKYRPDLAGMDRNTILSMKSDPALSREMTQKYADENSAGLKSSGFDPSPGNAYLAHFAGLGGARSVLGADPATPVSQILDPAAVAANPHIQNMTAGDLINWAGKQVGAAPAASPDGAAPQLLPPIEVASVGAPAGLLAPSPPDPATPDAQDPYAQMAKGLLAQSAPASRQQDPFAGDAPTASLLRPTAAPQFRGIQPMTRTRRFA